MSSRFRRLATHQCRCCWVFTPLSAIEVNHRPCKAYAPFPQQRDLLYCKMCVEHVTLWLGEMVQTMVMIRCGHTKIVLEKCAKARSLLAHFSPSMHEGRCRDTRQITTEVGTLCPRCQARGDQDPFYLYHMQSEPEHWPCHAPDRLASSRPYTARAATMPSQNSSQHLNVPRPSTSHQPLPGSQPSLWTEQGVFRPAVARSQTLPVHGLRRSNAMRRPASRAQGQ